MIDWRWLVVLSVALSACASEPAAGGAPAARELGLWEPVDARFAGCQGACGAGVHGPQDGVVAQPGAAVGQRTYCPVSGAVFEIDASHPHTDVDGQRLYFCCAGCAGYFAEHTDDVLRARGIGPRVAAAHAHAP